MPPLATWFHGHDGDRDDSCEMCRAMLPRLAAGSRIPTSRPTASPRSPSTAGTRRSRRGLPFAVNVLTFEGERIKEIDAFILRGSQDPDPEIQARTPEQPADYERLARAYSRFGLPATLE